MGTLQPYSVAGLVRPTFAQIDLDAIGHNVAEFATLIAPSELCAVVKADAYGHGDVPVANRAMASGAQVLAVALVEEGVRLREAGIDAPIMLLSEPLAADIPALERWELSPTVYSRNFTDALIASGITAEVHVKIDTGMHRVGTSPAVGAELVSDVDGAKHLELGSVWTHFPVADEDPDYTRKQIEAFADIRIDSPRRHLANTAGTVLFPEAREDLCRVGLGIYGLHPCEETRTVMNLKPAMRVVTHVTHVQRLGAGERPSYGRIRKLVDDATVITAPIGYADGFSRALSLGGEVLIGGDRYPLAGTVTMDQIVVDVGDADVGLGDEVVIIGSQGGQEITADEWAGRLGTISYEVVCSIGPRVPRRYT